MPRSENEAGSSRPAFDWRGWLVLAWALGFGLLYGKMVVESRGHRLRDLVPYARSASPR